MICFPIFNTESSYFCYSMTNNKIYVGRQKPFKPNMLFYLGVYLVPLFSKRIDGLLANFQESVNIYIVISLLALIGGGILGECVYRKIMKDMVKELEELYLTDKQMREYILRGKHQFYVLAIVMGVVFISTSIFIVLSCCWERIVCIVLEFICSFSIMLLVLWLRPCDRMRLIKMAENNTTGEQ